MAKDKGEKPAAKTPEETAADEAKMQQEMDDLAKRRAARAGSGSGVPEGDEEEGNGGQSIADRAKNGGGEDEEADGQFAFITEEQGKRVTLGTLIKRGTPIETRVSMGAKSNVLTGGLLDPEDANHLLMVRAVVGNVDTQFTRDDQDVITKATIYVHLKPKVVVNAKSEAAHVLLHGEPPSHPQAAES